MGALEYLKTLENNVKQTIFGKEEPRQVFKVGEGMTPQQTAAAQQVVRKPDSAMQQGGAKSYLDKLSATFSTPQRQEFRVGEGMTPAQTVEAKKILQKKDVPAQQSSAAQFLQSLSDSIINGTIFTPTPQAQTGLKETMSKEEVNANVAQTLEGKAIFGQRQPFTGKVVSDKDIGTGVARFGIDTIQATTRAESSLSLTLHNLLADVSGRPKIDGILDSESSPAALKLKNLVFGEGDIKSVESRMLDTNKAIQEYAVATNNKKLADLSLPLSIIGVAGSTVIDLTPFGGESKNAAKLIYKAKLLNDTKTIENTLRQMKISDEFIPAFSKAIKSAKSEDEIEKVLSSFKTIQDTRIDLAKTSQKTTAQNALGGVKNEKLIDDTFNHVDNQVLFDEAKKYKSAEEFIKAQGVPTYHGTNVDFKEFKNSKMGFSTGSESAKKGHFFTDNQDVARGYGEYASDRDVKILMDKAQQAEKSGDWDLAAKLTEQYEELAMDYKEPYIVESYVKLKNPLFYDAKGKGYLETDKKINDLIDKAKSEGRDGVVVKNLVDNVYTTDVPSTHTIVFDARNIKTKQQLTNIWEKANDIPTQLYGSVAGFETDEDGNLRFNPGTAMIGVGGMIAGKKATGFMKAEKSGKLFRGAKDMLKRFEVDDSGAKFIKPKFIEAEKDLQAARHEAQPLIQKWFKKTITDQEKLRLDVLDKRIAELEDVADNKNNLLLPDILDHPSLYKEYPDLKNVKIKFTSYDAMFGRGSYNDADNVLSVSKNILDDKDEAKSTILHEIQHAIQQKEGFARGGSPMQFKDKRVPAKLKDVAFRRSMEIKKVELILKEHGYSDLIKSDSPLALINISKPEIQKAIKNINDPKLDALVQSIIEANKKLNAYPDAFHQYLRLAGETESRNVQHRMKMTPAEREATVFNDTFDTPIKDQIVKYDSKTSSSIEENPKSRIFDEARKYKSAEEFVNNKVNIYHGGDNAFDASKVTSQGISTTKDKELASNFIGPDGGVLNELSLSDNAKILKEADIPKDLQSSYMKEAKILEGNYSQRLQKSVIAKQQEIIDYARKNGYDVVDIPFENELRIINPEVLKTKSQLTDIWKEANKAKPRRSLAASEKAFSDALELDKYEDVAKIVSKRKLNTKEVLKMEQVVTAKLKELRKGLKKTNKTRSEIIANDKNAQEIMMLNDAEKEARATDVTRQFSGVKEAITNSAYFRKEGSIDDRWIEAPIYKKGNSYRFALNEERKRDLISRGYEYHNSIDGMSNQIGMDAEEFLDKAFDEITRGREEWVEKIIHRDMMKHNAQYARINDQLEKLNEQYNQLKSKHANIKKELAGRSDLEATKEANRAAAKARSVEARNLRREEALANAKKVDLRMSSAGNVYVKLPNGKALTGMPRDIQQDLYSFVADNVSVRTEKLNEVVKYLNRNGLRLRVNVQTGERELLWVGRGEMQSTKALVKSQKAVKASQTGKALDYTGKGIKPVPAPRIEGLRTIKTVTPVEKGMSAALKKNEAMVRMNRAKQQLIKDNGSLQPVFRQHMRNLAVGKAQAQKAVNDFRNELKIKGFRDASDNIYLHEHGKAYSGRSIVEDKFNELYRKAQDLGIEFEKRKDYLPHVYNETRKEVKDAVIKAMREKGVSDEEIMSYLDGAGIPPELAKSLKMRPFFTHERAFDTYAEAAKYGLTPRYETVGQLIGHYTDKLNEVMANRQLVADLTRQKLITSSPKYGDIPVLLPGQEGIYFADPKAAAFINDVFRNEDALNIVQKGFKYGAKLSKGMQDVVLSGGAPLSSANFFSFGYVVKSITAGVGNLATLNIRGASTQLKVIRNFIRSNYTKRSIQWFEKRVDNGTLMKMAGQGIDLSNVMGNYRETGRGIANFYHQVVKPVRNQRGKEAIAGVGKIFTKGYDKVFSDKTFNAFLPMQSITIFEDTYKMAIKKGMAEEEAAKLAGKTTKLFMGISDNIHGKTADDMISTTLFAPRFREGLINVYWNSIKSISPSNWRKLEYAQNRKLMIGMGVTFFGLYDQVNLKLTGHHMWENPPGKEMNLMIPGDNGKIAYVPFMPSQLAFFRNMAEGSSALVRGETDTAKQKYSTLLSMPIQAINSVVSNKDYFGKQIYDPDTSVYQQAKDAGAYLGLNYNHPYINGLISIAKEYQAREEDIYPTYVKITDLKNAGKKEEANNMIDSLSEDDREAYEEMKQQKLKPLDQVLIKMFEIPIYFSDVGSVKSSEYFRKINDIKRDIKSLSEDERTDKIQEYIKNTEEGDRQGLLFALKESGIDVTGVSTSSDIIKMRPVYDRVHDLDKEGREDEAQQIVDNLSDEDYESYKKVIASVNSKITRTFKNKLEYDPYEAVKYLNSLPEAQGDRLLDNMSDEEYDRYSEGLPRYREEKNKGF